MLGTTAGRLFWMFRNLERSENAARVIEAALRIALTRSASARDEWRSVITIAGSPDCFLERHGDYATEPVIDYLLRDEDNPLSVKSVVHSARESARGIRTALTREVWEATNESWMTLMSVLDDPVPPTELPDVLRTIMSESAYVRGAMHGTMTRNDMFNFARLGTFVERADNTARILDAKYHLLLPSLSRVGARLDTVQWETILRALAARRAYRWVAQGDLSPPGIVEFAILNDQMPRSLLFCSRKIASNLTYLQEPDRAPSRPLVKARELTKTIEATTIEDIVDRGLHEFLRSCIDETAGIANLVQQEYRFNA